MWCVAFELHLIVTEARKQCSVHGSPSKKALEQQVLGPHNAVDGLVGRVTNGAHRVGFGSLLRPALKALGLPTDVRCCLHVHTLFETESTDPIARHLNRRRSTQKQGPRC